MLVRIRLDANYSMRRNIMKLEGKSISFAYKKDSPILNDISISIPNNKVIGLIGDSGSGKSTLCKILSGYIPKYDGDVTIDNNPIDSKDYNPVQLIFQHSPNRYANDTESVSGRPDGPRWPPLPVDGAVPPPRRDRPCGRWPPPGRLTRWGCRP